MKKVNKSYCKIIDKNGKEHGYIPFISEEEIKKRKAQITRIFKAYVKNNSPT